MEASIRAYYERGGELTRLDAGKNRIEFLRTQDVLRRVLPHAPARVLDVGGATGVHARWLAAEGHRVRLVDPVPFHVAEAATIPGVDATQGDARALDEPDDAYDATLLLGPLYHLVEPADRLTALREAARVTRPGGIVVAATINRYAGMWDAVQRGRYPREPVRAILDVLHGTGVYRPDDEGLFTLAYFSTPDEIRDEFAAAGLPAADRYAVESASWLFAEASGLLDDGEQTAWLLAALREVERDESQLGVSSHLLTVACVG